MAPAKPTAAYEVPGETETVEASTDLSDHQFRAIVTNGDGQAAKVSAQGTAMYGVLQNKPSRAGSPGTVMKTGITRAVAAGAIDRGDLVTTSDDGRFETAGAGDVVVGTARTAAANEDELFALDFGRANLVGS